jgi:hypothetical protein
MRACLYAGLCFGLSLVASCDARGLFQRFSEPNGGNCMAVADGCGAGQTCNSATQTCEASFDLTSVDPQVGSSAGGTRLTLTGSDFRPDLAVRFGGGQSALATDVKLIDDTHLELTLPPNPGSDWEVPVAIEVPGHSVSKTGLFSYYSPSPSFTPQSLTAIALAELVAAGDFNHDAKQDLVFARNNSSDVLITTLTGNGDGTFNTGQTMMYTMRSVQTIALRDMNNDGYDDLVVGFNGGVAWLLSDQHGGFIDSAPKSPDTNLNPFVIAMDIADFDQDGFLDVVCVNQAANSVGTLFNNGQGGFGSVGTFEKNMTPIYAVAGDWNGDGFPDLITSSGSTPVLVRINNKQYGSAPGQIPSISGCVPSKLIATDTNEDHALDVAVLCADATVRVLMGNERRARDDFSRC